MGMIASCKQLQIAIGTSHANNAMCNLCNLCNLRNGATQRVGRRSWRPKFTLRIFLLYPSLISVQLAPGIGVGYRIYRPSFKCTRKMYICPGRPTRVPHVIPVFPLPALPGGRRRGHQPQAVLVILPTCGPGKW